MVGATVGGPFFYTNIVGAVGVFCVMDSLKNPHRTDIEGKGKGLFPTNERLFVCLTIESL